jgi:hypothetical protein
LTLYILAVPSLLADAILVPVRLNETSNISSLWPSNVAKLFEVFLISHNLHVLSIDDVTIWEPEKLNWHADISAACSFKSHISSPEHASHTFAV